MDLRGRPKCYSIHLGILPLIVVVLVFFGYGFLSHRSQELVDPGLVTSLTVGELDDPEVVALSRMAYAQPQVLTPSRKDVLVLTPWLAPIIWEGTFNIDILNEQFRLRNTTVGLTVFAIKKYVVFLKLFLETAEQHFMVGHKVTYYVFTDHPADVPQVPLGAGRKLVVLTVRNYMRWQDVSMHRMEMISHFSERRFLHEVDYLLSGVWFVKATVNERNLTELGRPLDLFPYTLSCLEHGTLEVKTTVMYEGQCIKTTMHMQRTEKPGQYSSFSGHKLLYIYELPVKDHYIIYIETLVHEKKFLSGHLIGKCPKENMEALEEFKKFTQHKGLLQENIIVPQQREHCVPKHGRAHQDHKC